MNLPSQGWSTYTLNKTWCQVSTNLLENPSHVKKLTVYTEYKKRPSNLLKAFFHVTIPLANEDAIFWHPYRRYILYLDAAPGEPGLAHKGEFYSPL
jgi:hypothetical protein